MTGGGVVGGGVVAGVVAAAGTAEDAGATLGGGAVDASVGGRFDEEHAVAIVIAVSTRTARVGKRNLIDAMYGRRGPARPTVAAAVRSWRCEPRRAPARPLRTA